MLRLPPGLFLRHYQLEDLVPISRLNMFEILGADSRR